MTAGKHWRRQAAVDALLVEPTIAVAARRAGISERTLRRWVRDATFAAALQQAQRAQFEARLDGLRGALPAAVDTVRSLLAPETPPGLRLRAAAELIGLALRATSLVELERRVARLEAANADPAERWPLKATRPQLNRRAG